MLIDINKVNEEQDILRHSLFSHPNNLTLRALYAHSLMPNVRVGDYKIFRDFIFNTSKHDSHDVCNLCATGWLHYLQARESRETNPKGAEERKRNFGRAAELYEKALSIDPMCAYTAQGLAIITEKDALGTLYGALGGATPEESAKCHWILREALEIFAKVRESIDDGSVYQNMGHCYYARDEFDRVLESVSWVMPLPKSTDELTSWKYETVSTKCYQGKNVSVLMCLCRSWYSKAIKD